MSDIIKLQNITMSYYGKTALQIENLEFDGFLGVLGCSGSGKSNLIKIIAGTEFIDSGKLFLNDVEFGSKKIKERELCLISKDTPLFINKSVEYNLTYPLKLRMRSKEIFTLVDLAAQKYALDLKAIVHTLNEKQIAALYVCRALLRLPKILLLDQPDIVVGDLSEFLALLKKNYAGIIVYASYDYDDLKSFCSNFLVLKQGVPIFFGDRNMLESTEDIYIRRMIFP